MESVKTVTGRHPYPEEEVVGILNETGMFYDDRERVGVVCARVSSNERKRKGDPDRRATAVPEKAGSLNNPTVLKEVGGGCDGKGK